MQRHLRVVAVSLAVILAGAVIPTGPACALQVGEKAPDFTLQGTDGKPVKLSDLTARGPVVLYTFIQAFTGTWTKELLGFDALNAQFEAAGAQVVGVSADHYATLDAWKKANPIKHTLLADFRRQMLPTYDAMVTDEKSPIYRYAKRAYFIIDRTGTVKFMKIQPNPLDLLNPEEVLAALKATGS